MTMQVVIGSAAHKELFCREFIDTHRVYDADAIAWPELDAATLERLRALPFWGEAVSTESEVARIVQALAPLECDPLVREAIALQGSEEGRHARLIRRMTEHYGISVAPPSGNGIPADVEWAFVRTGYGECFDSFFAFGLLSLAQTSGFFPTRLIELFDPIVQEEARHILFFVNWIAHRRAQMAWWKRPRDFSHSTLAVALQVWGRIQTARGTQTDDFMMKSSESMQLDISPRAFIELCLRENERRLSPYDRRLLRPRFVPAVARAISRILPA